MLGAQDPHNGNICYFTPLNGTKKPGPGINCCVSSEPRGISLIPELTWGRSRQRPGGAALHGGLGRDAIRDDRLADLVPEGRRGAADDSRSQAQALCAALRVPQWTRSFTATVGKQKLTGKPGSYLTIDRDWKAGDTVAVDMDMTVRVLPGGKSYPGRGRDPARSADSRGRGQPESAENYAVSRKMSHRSRQSPRRPDGAGRRCTRWTVSRWFRSPTRSR